MSISVTSQYNTLELILLSMG